MGVFLNSSCAVRSRVWVRGGGERSGRVFELFVRCSLSPLALSQHSAVAALTLPYERMGCFPQTPPIFHFSST